MLQFVSDYDQTHLNQFLYCVVDTEEHKQTLTSHDHVVHHSHVSDQLDSTKCECRNRSSCSWKLYQKPTMYVSVRLRQGRLKCNGAAKTVQNGPLAPQRILNN